MGDGDSPAEIFLNFYVPVPPYEIQSAIASYLDAQCAKIDEIITQAKASIEDYRQWKASIIYGAVTRSLDPNVEMKDSGVEFIGFYSCTLENHLSKAYLPED